MWRHPGADGQGSDFFEIPFSQCLSFISMKALYLSVFLFLPGALTRGCGLSPPLLPHFIVVGSDGSCGSLVKRAKICSQNKSSSAAVAAASHRAVTHFLPVLLPLPSSDWRRPPPHPCPLSLWLSAERRTPSGETLSGPDLESY